MRLDRRSRRMSPVCFGIKGRWQRCLLLLAVVPAIMDAFVLRQNKVQPPTSRSGILLAKSRSHNKQAELAQKLARAKQQQQQQQQEQSQPLTTEASNASQNEEFAKLLNATQRALPRKGDFDDEQAFLPDIVAGKVKQKATKATHPQPTPNATPPKITASRAPFEALLDIETGQPLGPIRAAQLVPWVPPFLVDKLIIVCDPRVSSAELRSAWQYLHGLQESSVLRVMGITADAPSQAKGWLRKVSDDDNNNNVLIVSDPKLQWMTTYNVTESTWSLTLLIFDSDGVIQRMERDLQPSQVLGICQEEQGKQ